MAQVLARGGAPLAPVHPSASVEAVEWFRTRVPVTPDEWEALTARAQRGAFRVAGVTTLDVIAQVWRAIDSAVATGTDLRDFKREVAATLAAQWGAPNGSRVATVFRTNVQTAYSAGRYAVATNPNVQRFRPWWQFDAILDARTTEVCSPRDGIIKRADDSWWQSNYPPLHYQCRSGVITLTDDEALAEGFGTLETPGAPDAQSTFGQTPSPDAWAPDPANYPAPVWERWSNRHDNP